uniref:C2H2-type domain-containing protein n=1 Tax=Graphocephala atropunctata TaxID=36148 RepID=A0A1B6MPB4_9HEMI
MNNSNESGSDTMGPLRYEESGCLNLSSDVLINKKGSLVNDARDTSGLPLRVNNQALDDKPRISIENVLKPDRVEITPIFKKRKLLNSLSEPKYIKDQCQRQVLTSNFCYEESPKLMNESKNDSQNLGHEVSDNIPARINQGVNGCEIEASDTGISPSEQSSEFLLEMNGDVDSSISQHFLTRTYGVVGCQETNLEMLIGWKSDDLLYCKLCGLEYIRKEDVTHHINTNHSSRKDFELSITCPFCPYKNINRYKLSSHVSSHTTEKPFRCTMCSYGTTSKTVLKKHMYTHSDAKPHKCSECSYACNEKYKLRVHRMNQHGAGEKPFQCKLCSYSSAEKSTLKRHMMVHSESKLYKCDSCSYTGNSIHDLRKHEATHTDIKPFTCTECGFTCAFNSNLRKHMKSHVGEKRYKCSECSFSTMLKAKIVEHTLKHSKQCSYSMTDRFKNKPPVKNDNIPRNFKLWNVTMPVQQGIIYNDTCLNTLKKNLFNANSAVIPPT